MIRYVFKWYHVIYQQILQIHAKFHSFTLNSICSKCDLSMKTIHYPKIFWKIDFDYFKPQTLIINLYFINILVITKQHFNFCEHWHGWKRISNVLLWTPTQTCQCWPTRKDLHTSDLCGHWMQSVGPANGNGQQEQMPKENQGTPCYPHKLSNFAEIHKRKYC